MYPPLLSARTFKSLTGLLIILLLFANGPLSAALYTFSGNATTNGINGPIQKCDAKWIGQAMIYPSSGFNGGAGFGLITTVGFRLVGSGSSLSIPFKIYLKSVGATTTLTGTPTWATALSGATLAYSGNTPATLTAGNWYDIILGTPFNWSSGNLEVLVECDWAQVTGCGTTPVWAYNTAAGTDQEWLSNSSAAALQTTAGLAVDQYRPDIRLVVTAAPPVPTITSFTPASACSASGATVTITGTNFTGALSVSFNGTPASFSVTNATEISATLPGGATTGVITVVTSGGTATSATNFTVNPTPTATATPGVQSVCSGVLAGMALSSNVGGTTYAWTRTTPSGISGTMPLNGTTDPSGTLINSTTSDIIVNFSITPSTATCTGNATSANIVVQALPATPGIISGATPVCSGSVNTYSIANVSGATSYTWTLPNGWSGTSTNSIISATAGNTGGTISVTADNACGSSSAQTLVVSVSSAAPILGAINGPSSVCNGDVNTYSVVDIGASSYTWTLPNGWTGSSVANSISATSGASGGTISVTANSNCGNSSPQTLTVNIETAPVTPGTISGPTSICSGSINAFSVAAVNGATGYTWTLPNGWTGTSATETISTTANSTAGDVMVTADNACGSSAAQTLSVSITTAPATPGTISGANSICSGSTNSYSVATVSGAVTYTWTLPNGWSGNSTTESINAVSGTTGGDVLVTANNNCGSSGAQTITVTVNPLPTVSFNFTQNPVCQTASPISLSGSPSGGTFSGQGVSGTSFDPATLNSGSYVITYDYTDINSCASSDTSTVVVTICTDVNTVDANNIEIYPNPSVNGKWKFVCGEELIGSVIKIYDNTGRLVYKSAIVNQNSTIEINEAGGIYLMKINSETKSLSFKLIKM